MDLILLSCAESKIPALKILDNYSEKFYTVFPERSMNQDRIFLSPVVNWMKKTRSLVK